MASAGLRKELECSICLDLYTDPVTLRCGHNFCWDCIDQHLNTQDESGVYSCPECREEFEEEPVLQRNITLCNVVENFLSTHKDHASIFCSYCVDSPAPAVKPYVHSEASQCDKHLTGHSKGPEHVLTDPSTNQEKRKCSAHKKILEYYCSEDAACICVSCSETGEHRGHQMEMLDEVSEKKKKLRNVLQKLKTQREETSETVQSLEEHRRKCQEKASVEAERVTALFVDIRRWLDDLEKEVLSDISRQEEQRSLSDLIQKLEIKKTKLSRKMRHIEKLCNLTDPLTVLQDSNIDDLCDPEEEHSDEDTEGYDGGDLGVEMISHTLHKLIHIIKDVNVAFYEKGPADILLDLNTAANNIVISGDLKTATWTDKNQNRPETAERFPDYQVISSRRFISGRHYWDVQISRSKVWSVGMCYPSIDRRGRQLFIGNNNKSWCLYGGHNNRYLVIHDSKVIQLPHQISSDKFRIFVDYEARKLSFYELCDPIRHLHTFSATFTEPLHAAVCVWEGFIKILGGSSSCEEPSS